MYPLKDLHRNLSEERRSLAGRTGRVPRDLHEQRCRAARLLGREPDDLPFVAELLEMGEGWGEWRKAAELALGGLALTLLVDEDLLPDLRRAVNPERWKRRIRFEGVPVGMAPPPPTDAEWLPGRLVTKPGPFAGWLATRIAERFRFRCVDDPADLSRVAMGLTVTGQTSQGRRGAHGGNTGPAILGFSSAERLAEIDDELAELAERIDRLAERDQALAGQRTRWNALLGAHTLVRHHRFADIDTAAAAERVHDVRRRIARVEDGNDVLRHLRDERDDAVKASEQAQRRYYTAETELGRLTRHAEACRAAAETAAARVRHLTDRPDPVVVGDDQQALLDHHCGPVDGLDDLAGRIERTRTGLLELRGHSRETADAQGQILVAAFRRYQDTWKDPNLGLDPDEDYPGYHRILTYWRDQGLAQAQDKFTEAIADWTGNDLLQVQAATRQSLNELQARLDDVNAVLADLPFGPDHDRLVISKTDRYDLTVKDFRATLKRLTSRLGEEPTVEEAEARFAELRGFVSRLERGSGERDRLLDVRRHVYLEAERRSHATGARQAVYETMGEKSGGEGQETMAFILAAALRYQLGDTDYSVPQYGTVVMDESMIKADAEFSGRAIAAWQGLGFQLVLAGPNHSTAALEPYVDAISQTVKVDDRTLIATMDGGAGPGAGR